MAVPTPPPVNAEAAAQAIAEGLAAYPRFAPMVPRVERVALFRGSALQVRFGDDKRTQGDPENFAFEKVVLKAYRAKTGES